MEEQMPRTGAPIAALALAALMATSVVQAQLRAQVAQLRAPLVQPLAAKPPGIVTDVSGVPVEQEIAGHSQVHRESTIALQAQEQVLPPPLDALDRPPRDRPFDLARRLRSRPALVQHLRVQDPPAGDLRLELAANRLDFGKLRHHPDSNRAPPGGATKRSPAGAP